MKAYKIELLVIDLENMGPNEIRIAIENTKYVSPNIVSMQEAEIGEWSDDHPLNHPDTWEAEYRRILDNK